MSYKSHTLLSLDHLMFRTFVFQFLLSTYVIFSMQYDFLSIMTVLPTWFNFIRATLVQSRIKALEKLPNLEAVSEDPALSFKFGTPEGLPAPVLQLDGTWFSYSNEKNKLPPPDSKDWILKDVDLTVDLQSRIAVGCYSIFLYTVEKNDIYQYSSNYSPWRCEMNKGSWYRSRSCQSASCITPSMKQWLVCFCRSVASMGAGNRLSWSFFLESMSHRKVSVVVPINCEWEFSINTMSNSLISRWIRFSSYTWSKKITQYSFIETVFWGPPLVSLLPSFMV